MVVTPQEWQRRYTAARADLLDVEHVLDLRARLATATARVAMLTANVATDRLGRVGLFTGSFNPLTVAHVATAHSARSLGHLDTLVWAFSRVTVDKERVERAALVDRVAQLESYVRDAAPADLLAVVAAGLYADQAEAFRSLLAPGADLWLVVGFDKVIQIFDPHYYADREAALHRLFAASGLLVAPRAGHQESDLAALLAQPENRPYADRVRYLPLPAGLADVSSTAARAALASASVEEGAAAPLAGVVAPEGAALALTTAAYASPTRSSTGEIIDRYGLRLAWLAALADLPAAERAQLDLARVVERSAAPTANGATIRRWLRGERWSGGPISASDLLARST